MWLHVWVTYSWWPVFKESQRDVSFSLSMKLGLSHARKPGGLYSFGHVSLYVMCISAMWLANTEVRLWSNRSGCDPRHLRGSSPGRSWALTIIPLMRFLIPNFASLSRRDVPILFLPDRDFLSSCRDGTPLSYVIEMTYASMRADGVTSHW